MQTLKKDSSVLIVEVKFSTNQEQRRRKLKPIKMKSEDNFQEMQILEQNLQNLLLQKQAFQMELVETQSALKEIKKSNDDVFKLIGQLMIKTEKKKIIDELENKNKILELRIKNLEKQEVFLTDKLEKIREEIMKQREK